MIYFIQGADGGPIKVGFTASETVDSRLRSLRTGNPNNLECIGSFESASRHDEAEAHRILSRHRVHGEWFESTAARRLLEFRRIHNQWPWASAGSQSAWEDYLRKHPTNPHAYTLAEAARLAGCTPQVLRMRIRRGSLRRVKVRGALGGMVDGIEIAELKRAFPHCFDGTQQQSPPQQPDSGPSIEEKELRRIESEMQSLKLELARVHGFTEALLRSQATAPPTWASPEPVQRDAHATTEKARRANRFGPLEAMVIVAATAIAITIAYVTYFVPLA